MTDYTKDAHALPYPQGVDRVAVAADLQALAAKAGVAITQEGARVEGLAGALAEDAYQRAKPKRGVIPNGSDVREFLYGAGKDGNWSVLSGGDCATMVQSSLPEDLQANPKGFTVHVATMTAGVTLKLTVYDVYGNAEYTSNSAPSGVVGWTPWDKTAYMKDIPKLAAPAVPSTPGSGFKTLPLILTAGRGGDEAKAPLSANVEYDVSLAPSIQVSRYRFAIRDGNPRWGTFTAQAIRLSNISVGGVQKLSAMTTNADGSITFSPWMTGNFGNLKFDYTASAQPRYLTGGGRVNGTRRTEMPFELWLEVEVPATTPAIGIVGDSNSVGVNTTIPIHDAWMSQHCRRVGAFPVIYGHSGDAMSQAQTVEHYKWNRWNHLDRPDMVVHANGANDLPSTEGGVTLAEMQDWARNEWAISDTKISKIKHGVVLKSRASGVNNAVRVQYNDWIKTLPEPLRDWQDIASPVTTNDTGGLLPLYISSDGIHMNTGGQTAIANSITRPMVPAQLVVSEEKLAELEAAALGIPLLANGSFREGLAGWTNTGAWATESNGITSWARATSGADGALNQTVTLPAFLASRTLRLTAIAWTTSTGSLFTRVITAAGNTDATHVLATGAGQTKTLDATIPASQGSTPISVQVGRAAGNVYMTGIRLEAL